MDKIKRLIGIIIVILIVVAVLISFSFFNFTGNVVSGGASVTSEPLRIYIALDGNDGNNGSINYPIKTLQKAKSLINPNANKDYEVIFRHGFYRATRDQIYLNYGSPDYAYWDKSVVGHKITFRPMEGEMVFIHGDKELQQNGYNGPTPIFLFFDRINNISIDSLFFQNYLSPPIHLKNASKYVTIKNNIFENIGNRGIGTWQVTRRQTWSPWQCNTGESDSWGILPGYSVIHSFGPPVHSAYNRYIDIANNIFTNIHNRDDLPSDCEAYLHAIYLTGVLNVNVKNNIFYNGGNAVKFLNGNHNSVIEGNIFQRTGGGQVWVTHDEGTQYFTNNMTVKNNFWWRPSADNAYGGEVDVDDNSPVSVFGNTYHDACPSSKPFAVLTKSANYAFRGCCSSQYNCIDSADRCYLNNALTTTGLLCFSREWNTCNSTTIGKLKGNYNCTLNGWQENYNGIQWANFSFASSEFNSNFNGGNAAGEPLGYNCYTFKNGTEWKKSSRGSAANITLTFKRKVIPKEIEIYGQESNFTKLEVKDLNGNWQVAWSSTFGTKDYCFNKINLSNINYAIDTIRLTSKAGAWGGIAGVLLIERLGIQPVACTSNSQCGTSFYGNNYCSLNNVYKNYTSFTCNNAGTASSSCSSSTTAVLNATCSDYCSSGTCLSFTCHNNADCNDNNALTTDSCLNQNTTSSQCIHNPLNVACTSDSGCGTSSYGNNYCSLNNVYKNYTSFTCNNAGTASSSCSSSTTAVLNATCSDYCEFGICKNYICNNNLDCNDNNALTLDVCKNASTSESYCFNALNLIDNPNVLTISQLNLSSSNGGIFLRRNNSLIIFVNNITNQVNVNNIRIIFSNVSESSNYVIIRNLSLPAGQTKNVYLQRKNISSNAVCYIDSDVADGFDISDCIKLKCPYIKGNYSCALENNNFVVSGLRYSVVSESSLYCGDDICYDDESCSSCVSDCGSCAPPSGGNNNNNNDGGSNGGNNSGVNNENSQEGNILRNNISLTPSSVVNGDSSSPISLGDDSQKNNIKMIMISLIAIALIVLFIIYYFLFFNSDKRKINKINSLIENGRKALRNSNSIAAKNNYPLAREMFYSLDKKDSKVYDNLIKFYKEIEKA